MPKESTAATPEVIAMQVDQAKVNRVIKGSLHTAAGFGLVPLPGLDMLGVLSVQVVMVYRLAKLYQVPFSRTATRAIIVALIGSAVPHAFSTGCSRVALKMIPVVGQSVATVSMAVLSGAATWAVGKVFVQHFESGGNILNFNPEAMKEYFKEAFEQGKTVVKGMTRTPVPSA